MADAPAKPGPEAQVDDENTRDEIAKKSFVHARVVEDLQQGNFEGRLVTRFPPEPNGYLHIGHAKSITLNFGLAEDLGGVCNLRFDDTNPEREDTEYTDAIQEDIRWLGFDWGDRLFYASDYFEQLYQWAELLIENGLAYVDDQTADQIRETRGTLKEPGTPSPFRDRPAEENLDLFRRMKAGEFDEGSRVLRAKIDMSAPNVVLRDPALYRIRKAEHHRTGDAWCIYPMYDFAHGQSDGIEGVTHSICSLEFQNHRPLYDWLLEKITDGGGKLGAKDAPQQIEFARLKLTYTIMSKRKLRQLVEENHVDGWDDPRMPTLRGMRRRGYPPGAVREFCDRIGVSRNDSWIDVGQLESAVRDELNEKAPRAMGVLRPLKVVITNYPEGETEQLTGKNHPTDESYGTRDVPFSRELYIEQEDFLEDPPKKFFRLAPGREVRLRYAYFVTCTDVVKDDDGNVIEVLCTYDPETRGGTSPDGRKVKGTLHWVSAAHAVEAEVRLYDRLFQSEHPGKDRDFLDDMNPSSLEILPAVKLEPSLAAQKPGTTVQLERLGYFSVDERSKPGALSWNRVVTLKDSWANFKKRGG